MIGFAEGYFIIFGGLAVFGTIAAIYFYLQDRKEEQMSKRLSPGVSNAAAKYSTRQEPTNGDGAKAAEYFEKSLALSESIGDLQGRALVALVLRNFGKLSAKKGNITEAKSFFERALAIYEAMGDKLSMARVYNELGLLFSEGLESESDLTEKIEN
jgi:tetratricopeptide (TPR) repeat protein